MVNYYAPELTCYECVYYFHITFGALIYLTLALLVGIVVVTLYESKVNINITLNGRISSDFDKTKYLSKIILSLAFCFFGRKDYDWIMIIVLGVFSFMLLYTFLNTKPYMNYTVNLLYFISMSLFCWSSVILLIGKFFETSSFNGCLPLFVIGIPIIIISIVFYNVNSFAVLMPHITHFRKGTEALKQIRLLLNIIDNREVSRSSRIILKGYAYHYQTNCTGPLSQYNELAEKGSEPLALLLQHVESLFQLALSQFPNCLQLRITYSFFLFEYMNKKKKANKELLLSEKNATSLSESFLIFRSKTLLEELTTGINNNEDNLDFVSCMTYKNDFIQFKQMILRIALLYSEFWNLLLIPNKDQDHLAKLNDLGTNIISSAEIIQHLVDKMQKIKSKDHELLTYYSDFLNYILNDQEKALYYKNQRNNSEETRQVVDEVNLINMDTHILTTSDEYQYIAVSGKSDSFGHITNISLGICLLLGYTKKELVGKMYELLMPKIFHKAHKKLLINKLNIFKKDINNFTSNAKTSFRSILAFALTKAHYILPIKFEFTIIQTESYGITFLSKINPEIFTTILNQPTICYTLTDNNFIIQNFTVNAINLLGMTSWALNNNVEIITFINQFQQDFLKIALEKDELTQEEKHQIKKKIANTKYRKPSLINWKGNELLLKQRFCSTKINELDISESDLSKSKINTQECFYLTIEEIVIGGMPKGCIFKFELTPHSSQVTKASIATFYKEGVLRPKGIRIASPQHHSLDRERLPADMNFEQFIPEGPSRFQMDLNQMSYIHFSKNPNRIREEIKAKAYEKIEANIQNNESSSIEEDSKDSSEYSSKNSEESESDDIEINEINNVTLPKKTMPTKPIQHSDDDYYKVNLQNIKLSIYSYAQKTIVEVANYTKKSQVERKMNQQEDDYQTENTQMQTSKSIKKIDLFQDSEKNNMINQEQLLTQQIKYALSKKEAQPTIIKLRWVVVSIILFTLLFGSIWLGLLINAKLIIDNNFYLIKFSYRLLINCLISHAYIRDLTILQHENYTYFLTKDAIKKTIKERLSSLYFENYEAMNYVIINTYKLSKEHQDVLYNHSFTIKVIQDIYNYKALNMTLSSSLIELNIAAFQIINDISLYTPLNNNIYFYIFNVNNGITMQLEKLSEAYLKDYERIIQRIRISFYLLMTLGCGVLFGLFFIFSCTYVSVVKRKESYLEVFFEIESCVIRTSLEQCERLLKQIQASSFTEYLSFDDELSHCNNNLVISASEVKKKDQSSSQYQNSKSKEILIMKIAYCVFISLIIIYEGAHLGAFSSFLNHLTVYINMLQSQNDIYSEYNKLYRNTREYLFDEKMLIENQEPSESYLGYLSNYYVVISKKMNSLLQYQNEFPTGFSKIYNQLYQTDICKILEVNQTICDDNTLQLISNCDMTSLLSLFIEESRSLKNQKRALNQIVNKLQFKYNLTNLGTDKYDDLFPKDDSQYVEYFNYCPITLFNSELYERIYGIYEYFLKESFSMLSNELYKEIEKFILDNAITYYSISAVFLFLISAFYFFVWKPFETRLITMIFKTKNMLSIIPKEVLASLTNIRKLLNINLMSNKTGRAGKKLP